MRGLSKGFRERQRIKKIYRRNMVVSFAISSIIPFLLTAILLLIPVKQNDGFFGDWRCPGFPDNINVVFAQTIDTNQPDSSQIDDKTDNVLRPIQLKLKKKENRKPR